MYKPGSRWAWIRYTLYAATGVLLILTFGFRTIGPHRAPPPAPRWQPHNSNGRVIIPNVPRQSDARFDDQVIATVPSVPTGNERGCWRLQGLGNDAGTTDRVECRLQADLFHLFEIRHPSGEPDVWRIAIPRDNREAVLLP